MKVAIRGGHNFQATGANALLDETTEDRKVKDAAVKYLRVLGIDVLDVTPGKCDQNTDLAFGVNKANAWGAEYFISIHLNKAYTTYTGAIGTEAWVHSMGGKSQVMASRITSKISSLGFKNRGVKVSAKLYELNHTKMNAIIIEVCFVEATEDVKLYKSKGSDLIGKIIAEAIGNKTVPSPAPIKNTVSLYRVQTGAFGVKTNADALQAKLKAKGFDTCIVEVDKLYKVQVGAYGVKSNADLMVKKLKSAGYDSFITS